MRSGRSTLIISIQGMVINPIVGVCIPIVRIPIKGGVTIPNMRSLDPGTYVIYCSLISLVIAMIARPSEGTRWNLARLFVTCQQL